MPSTGGFTEHALSHRAQSYQVPGLGETPQWKEVLEKGTTSLRFEKLWSQGGSRGSVSVQKWPSDHQAGARLTHGLESLMCSTCDGQA